MHAATCQPCVCDLCDGGGLRPPCKKPRHRVAATTGGQSQACVVSLKWRSSTSVGALPDSRTEMTQRAFFQVSVPLSLCPLCVPSVMGLCVIITEAHGGLAGFTVPSAGLPFCLVYETPQQMAVTGGFVDSNDTSSESRTMYLPCVYPVPTVCLPCVNWALPGASEAAHIKWLRVPRELLQRQQRPGLRLGEGTDSGQAHTRRRSR